MLWMSACHARIRRTLRKRNSGGIIRLGCARNDVRGLIVEYRRFRAEAEAALVKDGISITGTARALLLEAWSDMLAEHQA
jgi:hypothetical protein